MTMVRAATSVTWSILSRNTVEYSTGLHAHRRLCMLGKWTASRLVSAKSRLAKAKGRFRKARGRLVRAKGWALTWLPALTVNGIVVAAAKLAGDSALATGPLAWSAEGAAPQPPLLALHTSNPGDHCDHTLSGQLGTILGFSLKGVGFCSLFFSFLFFSFLFFSFLFISFPFSFFPLFFSP